MGGGRSRRCIASFQRTLYGVIEMNRTPYGECRLAPMSSESTGQASPTAPSACCGAIGSATPWARGVPSSAPASTSWSTPRSRLADDEGIEALSMRRIAERLGLKPMSVYTYVPGKAELIDLMVDRVAGEEALPELDGSLRERLDAGRPPRVERVPAASVAALDRHQSPPARAERLGSLGVEPARDRRPRPQRPRHGPGRHARDGLRSRTGPRLRRRRAAAPHVDRDRRGVVGAQRAGARADHGPLAVPDLGAGRHRRRRGVRRRRPTPRGAFGSGSRGSSTGSRPTSPCAARARAG